MDNSQIIREIFFAGIESVLPDRLIHNSVCYMHKALKIDNLSFDLTNIQHVYIIGAGKASALMARSLEAILGSVISGGHIVTKYGHSVPLKYLEISEAGHPVPDENGLEGTARIVAYAQKADKHDLVICLLSGGGSSLLVDVPKDCTLSDLAFLNDLLLKSGADIEEINCVRKHLSMIKGGKLAKIAAPAFVISLILSDVIGDPVDVIASGPTAADQSTFLDALAVINRFNLSSKIARPILQTINQGVQGKRPETLKIDDGAFNRVCNVVIGNNRLALEAAKVKAESFGYAAQIETDSLHGDVSAVADYLVECAVTWKQQNYGKKGCLLFGGEPTVKITGNGLGGRNQHLALLCARLLENHPQITILSGGTDGTDGPTDAAGAVIDFQTLQNAKKLNLDVDQYLKNCDSNHFFQKTGGLIITGPTQTNVMDIIIVLIG